MMLVRLAFEALTKVRLRNPNESFSALRDRRCFQIHESVLGNDEHHVRGLAAFRGVGSAHELQMPN